MTEDKPPIDKVSLVPDQPLTPQENQECVTFLTTYEPKIHWEVGHKVIAYLGTKIVDLYIRNIDPRNRFFGYLGETGEIIILDHQQIGETHTPTKKPDKPPSLNQPEPPHDPILVIHRVPPNIEIEIKIKALKECSC